MFLATVLLNYALTEARKDPKIIEVYLHVQTNNLEAKEFYISHGFEQAGIIENYYKRIDPPGNLLCVLTFPSISNNQNVVVIIPSSLSPPSLFFCVFSCLFCSSVLLPSRIFLT